MSITTEPATGLVECDMACPQRVSCLIARDMAIANPAEVITIDTETTGLDPDSDELLSIAIINGDGETVFHSLIHPYGKGSWPEAQRVNRITPGMVRDAPSVCGIRDAVDRILSRARIIIGYHVGFDLAFLRASGFDVPDVDWCDVMEDFVPIYEEIHPTGGRWQKLTTCASFFGYDFVPHDALEDAKATLFCCGMIAHRQEKPVIPVNLTLTSHSERCFEMNHIAKDSANCYENKNKASAFDAEIGRGSE